MMASPRVLVIDDEPMMLELASEMLRAFGFEVLTALSGEAGLDVTRKARPDVVLCDIMMPGMDGREVCRRIKDDPALEDIPVVLNSSLREDEVDWRASGADAYREKTQELRALPVLLRRFLGGEGADHHS